MIPRLKHILRQIDPLYVFVLYFSTEINMLGKKRKEIKGKKIYKKKL